MSLALFLWLAPYTSSRTTGFMLALRINNTVFRTRAWLTVGSQASRHKPRQYKQKGRRNARLYTKFKLPSTTPYSHSHAEVAGKQAEEVIFSLSIHWVRASILTVNNGLNLKQICVLYGFCCCCWLTDPPHILSNLYYYIIFVISRVRNIILGLQLYCALW